LCPGGKDHESEFIDRCDEYLQEHLKRRDFFKRLTVLAEALRPPMP
jgi:hypothetical protein